MNPLTRIRLFTFMLTAVLVFTAVITGRAGELSAAETADGFVPVFKGTSLAGWHGATNEWVWEHGRLIYQATKPAHSSKDLLELKLMSPDEYADFILRFEFKLEKSANNGVAIRAPLEGDPAFVGMEIQVIDTPNWKNLKFFQVHGSIYGVVAAKTGHLKEPGTWNSEEILCQGRQVKVTLNGVVITDANLDEVGAKTLDKAAHPGVKREKGHIGFLGHTGKAEFRNIRIKELSKTAGSEAKSGVYFPPPESQGGWRKLDSAEDIRRVGGMDPQKLDQLREWLLQSDKRNFAATVIHNGWIVLEVERGNSAKTDARRVASCSKAVCATVLAIASEQSQQRKTLRKMTFDDKAFDFIPWAQPLSDPRKAQITVKQLLNHTSGICPEATGAPNDGKWDYIMGHTGDKHTAQLAFDPGTGCGYSTHGLTHAALVCETVTGKPYDQFAIEALFKPLGIEHWWFQYYEGGEKYGRHPSHGLGMPARDLARIAWCMLNNGRWG